MWGSEERERGGEKLGSNANKKVENHYVGRQAESKNNPTTALETIPKSTLSERVPLALKILHNIGPVISTGLDVLEKADEDIFVNVGVPNHHLTLGHDV